MSAKRNNSHEAMFTYDLELPDMAQRASAAKYNVALMYNVHCTSMTTMKSLLNFLIFKKINRDFIKGGRGEGSPIYEVISQKIFNLTKEGFPNLPSTPSPWICLISCLKCGIINVRVC